VSVGKIIGAVVGVALIAVGVITGNPLLIIQGVAVTAGALLGPSAPKIPKTKPTDRLYATLDPTTPRKWVFGGPTAMATDVRYQTYTGLGPGHLLAGDLRRQPRSAVDRRDLARQREGVVVAAAASRAATSAI
jgi:hypothetical protein